MGSHTRAREPFLKRSKSTHSSSHFNSELQLFFHFFLYISSEKIQCIFKWKKMCDVFLNKNDWLFFLLFFSPHFWLNLQMKILVPAFNFSYGCKFFTFLDSPSCAPHRLGGDCVFAIALLAPTFRQRPTYYRVRAWSCDLLFPASGSDIVYWSNLSAFFWWLFYESTFSFANPGFHFSDPFKWLLKN